MHLKSARLLVVFHWGLIRFCVVFKTLREELFFMSIFVRRILFFFFFLEFVIPGPWEVKQNRLSLCQSIKYITQLQGGGWWHMLPPNNHIDALLQRAVTFVGLSGRCGLWLYYRWSLCKIEQTSYTYVIIFIYFVLATFRLLLLIMLHLCGCIFHSTVSHSYIVLFLSLAITKNTITATHIDCT